MNRISVRRLLGGVALTFAVAGSMGMDLPEVELPGSRVSQLDPLFHLLRSSKPEDLSFPPTLLINEGWLLRNILDWFSRDRAVDSDLGFSPSAVVLRGTPAKTVHGALPR